MKCISLHAPYPHLIALGIKKYETRSWPCPPSIIGQRVAFASTKKRPRDVWMSTYRDDEFPAPLDWFYDRGMNAEIEESSDGEWWRYRWNGPLGCVVGSGVITASYPIVAEMLEDGWHKPWIQVTDRTRICETLLRRNFDDDLGRRNVEYVTDQLPYGDWTPGRYAWLIEDAAPTTERCPWCWGEDDTCDVCWNEGYRRSIGKCGPIPVTGRQGFFNWEPT